MDCFGSVHTSHMSKPNVARVLSATAWTASVHTLHIGTWAFEGTFEGSRPSKLGPLKVPLKVLFEGTFEGSRPSKLLSKGRDRRRYHFEGPLRRYLWRYLQRYLRRYFWRYLRRSLWLHLWRSKPFDLHSTSPPPASQQRTFVEGLKGPDLRRYLRRRVLTDYPLSSQLKWSEMEWLISLVLGLSAVSTLWNKWALLHISLTHAVLRELLSVAGLSNSLAFVSRWYVFVIKSAAWAVWQNPVQHLIDCISFSATLSLPNYLTDDASSQIGYSAKKSQLWC